MTRPKSIALDFDKTIFGVDRRGACNSAFIVHGDLTFAQVIRAARQVWARFTFPVVEVDERGMEVPR